MEWGQFDVLLITLGCMFFWLRSESSAYRRDILQMIHDNRQETAQMITSIHEEIKDFHGRLCAIEERNRK